MSLLKTGPRGKRSLTDTKSESRRDLPNAAVYSDLPVPAPLTSSIPELQQIAKGLRRHIVRMTAAAGSGHPGGSLSAVEIVTALHFAVMRQDPVNPSWPDRDRFILSKGHASPVLYAALAERGYFPVEDLLSLRKLGSHLQGHPDMNSTPGVEASTGSLGQGLSVGVGHALAARLDGRSYRVFVVVGDGECDEGQIWEAAMFASHHKLDNLVVVVDHNHMQIDGRTEEVVNLEPLPDKWRAFGWHTLEIPGHDFRPLLAAFAKAEKTKGHPTAIVAETIKGKGVSFMEGKVDFHGKAPTKEEAERALRELDEKGQP